MARQSVIELIIRNEMLEVSLLQSTNQALTIKSMLGIENAFVIVSTQGVPFYCDIPI